jgi:hypothetical protein
MRMSPYMKMHERRIKKHRSALRAAMMQVACSRLSISANPTEVRN